MRRPVERAKKGARRHDGIRRMQLAAPDTRRNQRPHALLVTIAFGDDGAAKARREGVDLQMRRRSLHIVDEAPHVGVSEAAEPDRQRTVGALRAGERLEEAIERAVLAEEEDLLLAAKVVVQIPGGEIGGVGDLAHAGGGEAVRAEDAGGGTQDLDPPRVRAAADASGAGTAK